MVGTEVSKMMWGLVRKVAEAREICGDSETPGDLWDTICDTRINTREHSDLLLRLLDQVRLWAFVFEQAMVSGQEGIPKADFVAMCEERFGLEKIRDEASAAYIRAGKIHAAADEVIQVREIEENDLLAERCRQGL